MGFSTILGQVGEGEGEVAFFSAKRWDRRNRADLIESATPCHDAQVMGLYRDSNPLRLTVLAAMSEDYTTAPQHLQGSPILKNCILLRVNRNFYVGALKQKLRSRNFHQNLAVFFSFRISILAKGG